MILVVGIVGTLVFVELVVIAGCLGRLAQMLEAQNDHYGIGVSPPDHSDDPELDGTGKFVCRGCGSVAPRRRSEHDRPIGGKP